MSELIDSRLMSTPRSLSSSEFASGRIDGLVDAWADLLVADYWARHGEAQDAPAVVTNNSPYTARRSTRMSSYR
jgi:hypothetical protein